MLPDEEGGWCTMPWMVIFVWLLGVVANAICRCSFCSWRSFGNSNDVLRELGDRGAASEAAAAAADTLETTDVTVDRSTVAR